MKRSRLNYIVDIVIALSFIALAVTGLLKYQRVIHFFAERDIILPANGITQVHRWSGAVLTAGAVLHLVLHWKWLVNMTKKAWRRVFPRRFSRWIPGIIGGVFIIFMIAVFRLMITDGDRTPLYPGQGTAAGVDEQVRRPQLSDTPPDFREGLQWETEGRVSIRGHGSFSFDPAMVETVRSDVFAEGAFSAFDILVHLDDREDIDLRYYFDEALSTHVIRSLNGEENWWYRVIYDGGWSENNVFRMDLYPYKERALVSFTPEREETLERIYDTVRAETSRLKRAGGMIVIPEVVIDGTRESYRFENVEVNSHNLRPDLFREGVITAIDVIMSLGDQDKIEYDIGWFDSIGTAEVVRSFFVQRINADTASGRCGFVYDSGSEEFHGFRGNHIHLPPDARVLTSPEYVRFFWICI